MLIITAGLYVQNQYNTLVVNNTYTPTTQW